jgi:hypothetical protein
MRLQTTGNVPDLKLDHAVNQNFIPVVAASQRYEYRQSVFHVKFPQLLPSTKLTLDTSTQSIPRTLPVPWSTNLPHDLAAPEQLFVEQGKHSVPALEVRCGAVGADVGPLDRLAFNLGDAVVVFQEVFQGMLNEVGVMLGVG